MTQRLSSSEDNYQQSQIAAAPWIFTHNLVRLIVSATKSDSQGLRGICVLDTKTLEKPYTKDRSTRRPPTHQSCTYRSARSRTAPRPTTKPPVEKSTANDPSVFASYVCRERCTPAHLRSGTINTLRQSQRPMTAMLRNRRRRLQAIRVRKGRSSASTHLAYSLSASSLRGKFTHTFAAVCRYPTRSRPNSLVETSMLQRLVVRTDDRLLVDSEP